MKRIAVATLGCKVNQYEAAAMRELFEEAGYRRVDFAEVADVYLIHTCTVTHMADRKARKLIRRARRRNPEGVVIVSGCYPQVAPEAVGEIEGVDLLLGTQRRSEVVELAERARNSSAKLDCIAEYTSACEFEPLAIRTHSDRSRALIKIEEGCEEGCSYCIVPRARGPVRSRPPEEILAEVEELTGRGFKEVVLTGVNLGAYGRDWNDGPDLAGILRRLHESTAVDRIRLSSVEPMFIDARLVELVAGLPRVCSHLHIPLQHGDDFILRRMDRKYTSEEYARLVESIRRSIPDAGISTDVMVGFPGEEEEHFQRLLSFVRRMRFSRMHVFRFSPRPGTRAVSLSGRVDPGEAKKRSETLRDLAAELARDFHSRFIGRELEVMVEEQRDRRTGLLAGFSGNYIRVLFPGDDALQNELVRVRVQQATSDNVRGVAV